MQYVLQSFFHNGKGKAPRIAPGALILKQKRTAEAVLFIRPLKTEERDKDSENETQVIFCEPELYSSSPRSISIGQLNTLLCVHLRPIKLIVYKIGRAHV